MIPIQKTFKFWPGPLEAESKSAHLWFAQKLVKKLAHCHGYLAYKMTNLGRAREDEVPSFLIITREHGIIVFDFLEERLEEVLVQDEQDFWRLDDGQKVLARSLMVQIYEEEIISRLKNDFRLYDKKKRQLKIPVSSAVVFYKNDEDSLEREESLSEYSVQAFAHEDFLPYIEELPNFNGTQEDLDSVIALLEGTFIYQEPVTYTKDTNPESFDDFIKLSLKRTFKQDDFQRSISMQLPNGPQRIRGLAGTGKTIVLSLKAAITHKTFPSFKVLYLFNTQSLYSQVQTLITKYYTSEAKKAPDFEDSVHVLHAWGGKAKKGLYSELCAKYGLMPLNYNEVRGKGEPLKVIYGDLLSKIGTRLVEMYDLVLIDEAQDFPEEVFEVIYKITKSVNRTKRIIWAYDEFQSLKDFQVKEPAELFGLDRDGNPNIPNEALEGDYAGEIKKDYILPNCYRTPRPVLMMAHGVALGLYSQVTQMFYNSGDWEAIGYSVISPETSTIKSGDVVKLERKDEHSKNILEGLLTKYEHDPLELVDFTSHANWIDELNYISAKINELILHENVPPEEIIVVNLMAGNNKASMLSIQQGLAKHGIRSILPGYVESADMFKVKGFVTISTPFRAKGNEANIVFVVNAQVVANDFTLRGRNAFFVAATRSRGWCYISGNGKGVEKLESEITSIRNDFPYFSFICPDEASIRNSRQFLKRSDKELDEIQRAMSTILGDEVLKNYMLDAINRSNQ